MESSSKKMFGKKPSKIEEMTKEQIRQAVLKKRECTARSQYIVESLLEKWITPEYLLKCLPEINQSHFDDVFEERSILHLCGYPICQNTLSKEDIPKQKYRISVKTNKVYDITTRKNFCSNSCYKSAMYLKKQMLTSPLWFREYEEIPTFHLLPTDSMGSMGLEVDVALINRVKINTPKKSFISINDFTTATFDEMTHNSDEKLNKIDNSQDRNDEQVVNISEKEDIKSHDIISERRSNIKMEDQQLHTNLNKENKCQTINKELNDTSSKTESLTLEADSTQQLKSLNSRFKDKPVKNPLNIIGEIIEKPENKIDPIILNYPNIEENKSPNKEQNNKKILKKQPILSTLTAEVENRLSQWFTLDTMLFLFGEEKVKEMVADKGKGIKEYLSNQTKGIFYNSNVYDQYKVLCRKLNMLELEDRKLDAQTLQRETKPLPDYRILQEESKKMKLKVKAFFAGETEIPDIVMEETNCAEDNENVTYLPLVDKKAQNALRRKIVYEHLNRVLPDLQRSLHIENVSITSDIKLLVNTLILKPNNIMFKPIQWTLISLIFINLLSLKDERLAFLLKQPTTYQHMQLLLLSYKQDGCYFQRLISWLTNIDRLLENHKIEVTV